MGGMHGTQLQRYLPMPQADMHCRDEGAVRRFATSQELWIHRPDSSIDPFHFFTYRCRNCGKSSKTIAIILVVTAEERGDVEVMKLGEYPPFGAPITQELRDLLGETDDLFKKGWSSERMGLGIGATAYYRRIVENKWHGLIEMLKTAAAALESNQQTMQLFDDALSQHQFANAVESLRDGLPPKLFLKDGVNPLTLLHDSLSKDLHQMSDEECLAVASATRHVLAAMVENVGRVQREHDEMKAAIKRLRR
jgi:hypothetical protein